MTLVDDFFRHWEGDPIGSFDEINEVILEIFERWIREGRQFAWRGAVDASWPLHSSLYRRLWWSSPPRDPAPDEAALSEEEHVLLATAHRWGLHSGQSGRLSVLSQLATLQHFGAPTRLVDVTLNAYIGLWFAVEQRFKNGEEVDADKDGRLFAIDITDRLINELDDKRAWEDDLNRPWKDLAEDLWCGSAWAWRPAPFQARIASQHGAFLLGGVPKRVTGGVIWPKSTAVNAERWSEDEVRRCTSLAFRFHRARAREGRPAERPAYTFRISAAAKEGIRARLHQVFGYSHQTLFHDYPGFAEHGMPHLKSEPPV